MTFNENIKIDSRRVKTSRASSGAAIGGLGGILAMLIFMFTGMDVSGILGGGATEGTEGMDISHCQTGADANERPECRMVATAESLDVLWNEILPAQAGRAYQAPGFEIFEHAVSTACGQATSAVGPFYCPGDQKVYLDLGFFNALESQLGAKNAPIAQMYIVAHEWGHHIQRLDGTMNQVSMQDTGPESGAVRLELQADCYAGIWVGQAANTVDPETGQTFLNPPTEQEMRDALSTAGSVGDDRIQIRTQGRAMPETFSHGTSEQRMRWFAQGYQNGSMAACNTFNVAGSEL